MCRGKTEQWVAELPSVLLGLRSCLRSDTQISAAELVYGEVIRLPGDFFQPTTQEISDNVTFLQNLRKKISNLAAVPKRCLRQEKIFVHPELKDCSHVFVRCDSVTKPLTPPYTGPFKVIDRTEKYYKIKQGESVKVISINRLKPAFLLYNEKQSTNMASSPMNDSDEPNMGHANINNAPKATRSGRISKPTVRFVAI